jgi:hypothetical protein
VVALVLPDAADGAECPSGGSEVLEWNRGAGQGDHGPRLRRRFIRCGRRSRDVGLGWGLSWKIRKKAPKDCQSFVPRVWPAEESDCYIFKSR